MAEYTFFFMMAVKGVIPGIYRVFSFQNLETNGTLGWNIIRFTTYTKSYENQPKQDDHHKLPVDQEMDLKARDEK